MLEFRLLCRGLPAPGDVLVGADEQCTGLINGTQNSPRVERWRVDRRLRCCVAARRSLPVGTGMNLFHEVSLG